LKHVKNSQLKLAKARPKTKINTKLSKVCRSGEEFGCLARSSLVLQKSSKISIYQILKIAILRQIFTNLRVFYWIFTNLLNFLIYLLSQKHFSPFVPLKQ
jgi:hypothetical protein